MDAQALNSYIRQEIRKEVHSDRIELYLPFVFGNGTSDTLCLVWNKDGVLSDGGRTFKELKKRVGDLTPYSENIQNILTAHGMVTLESGHRLTVRNFQTCICGDDTYTDYMAGLSRLLRVISQISIVDTIKVDEYGAVYVC